jgi:hypothetical protein
MLSSASAIVGGPFVATQSEGRGADHSSRIGVWSGSLVLELLAVPFLCAVPPLCHELASSMLLHARAPDAVNVSLGASELLPMVAVLLFMLYQLADGKLKALSGFAIGPDGDFYVAERWKQRVRRFSAKGKKKGTFIDGLPDVPEFLVHIPNSA